MKDITLVERLVGTSDSSYIIAILFFALLGVAISLLIHATNRKEGKKFKLFVLLSDNWRRIILNMLLIFVAIRFSKELTGLQLNEFTAVLIGISFDKISEWLKNKKLLGGKT